METLLAVIGIAAGVAGKWLFDRFRAGGAVQTEMIEADTAARWQQAWAAEFTRLQVHTDHLHERVGELERQIDRLQRLATALEVELIAIGGDPTKVRRRLGDHGRDAG